MVEPASRRLRVLIVEDHPDLGDVLVETISLMGHDARAARDGREALARWNEPTPDLALIDLGLPHLDGYEVARQVRAAGGPCFLVAITGYVQREVAARCRAAGFDLHLLKPVRMTTLEPLLACAAQLSGAASSIATSSSRAAPGSDSSSSTATLSWTAWA
jgi:CheY-like chemotaxis protein